MARIGQRLTKEQADDLATYNPETGEFFRKTNGGGCKVGDKMGSVMNTGYIEIGIGGQRWLGHRLAFLMMTGGVPKYVDHKDLNKANNRWSNLRPCSMSENLRNSFIRRDNSQGHKNVGVHKRSGLFTVRFKMGKRDIKCSYFKTKEEAINYADKMRKQLHGEFANFG